MQYRFFFAIFCLFVGMGALSAQRDFVVLAQGDTLYGRVSMVATPARVTVYFRSPEGEARKFVNAELRSFFSGGEPYLVRAFRGKKKLRFRYLHALSQGKIDLAVDEINDVPVYYLFLEDGSSRSFIYETFKERALPLLLENPRFRERFGDMPFDFKRIAFDQVLTDLFNFYNSIR